ncbi:hypothetical protein G7Y89_g10149 [Cudoniella acicularis]|uniref:C2H2-type domain-containing protein n=1 Tax=Cudoniella acicularis TaxID=354080 RepID=A0A8H4W183_9HELO|nr:hypothetical protein G7Y89_g10149 [Cudoniella acicularis]
MTTNQQQITRYTCNFFDCTTTFGRKSDLNRHMEEVHEPPKRCPFPGCTVEVKRKNRIATHIKKRHPGFRSLEFEFVLKAGKQGARVPQVRIVTSGVATGNQRTAVGGYFIPPNPPSSTSSSMSPTPSPSFAGPSGPSGCPADVSASSRAQTAQLYAPESIQYDNTAELGGEGWDEAMFSGSGEESPRDDEIYEGEYTYHSGV